MLCLSRKSYSKMFSGVKKFIVTLTMYTINCVNIITVTYQLFYEIEQNIDSCMSVIPVLRGSLSIVEWNSC